jgi:hypothetical protein
VPESPMLTDEAVEEMRNLDWARSCSPVGPHEQSAEFSRMRAQAFLAAQDRASLTRKCRGLSIYLCNGCGGRWLQDPGLHHDARYTAPAFVACQGKVAERVYIDRDLLLGEA